MPTVKELKEQAKELKVKGYSKMNKEALWNAVSLASLDKQCDEFNKQNGFDADRTSKDYDPFILSKSLEEKLKENHVKRNAITSIGIMVIIVISFILHGALTHEPSFMEKIMSYIPFF